MIPLRDDNPTRTVPYVVFALIIVNVIVFLYNGAVQSGNMNPLAAYELVPSALVTGRSPSGPLPVAPWVTIFTAMFMHANLLHIGGNMLYLWIFGNNIEDALGHLRFLVFYLLAGIAAALAHVMMAPYSTMPMIGASGAIAGVLGAYLVLFPRARVISLVFVFFFVQMVSLPASIVLGLWIILQIVNSLMMQGGAAQGGGVAYAAHVGGFVAGIVMIYLLGGKRLVAGREREW